MANPAPSGLERTRRARLDHLILTGLAGVAWLVFFSAATAVARGSPSLERFVGDVLYLLPVGAAALCACIAATRLPGRLGRAWRLLAVSTVLWLLGELFWSVYGYLVPDGPPTPSPADVGYMLSYLVALPAIVIGVGGAGALRNIRELLDSVLVAAGVGALGWQLAIAPALPGVRPEVSNVAALTVLAYPMLSLMLVSVVLAVMLSGQGPVPRSMLLVAGAFAVACVSDGVYAYLAVHDSYTNGSWVNIGWQAEAVLLCVAAVVAVYRPEPRKERVDIDRDIAIVPALIAVLTVAGLAAIDLSRVGRISGLTLSVATLLFLGLLARQFIATRERTHLARQLQTAAVTDPLTGLYNRRFFEEMLAIESARAVRHGKPLSVIMIDLDRFKRINDTYGHSAGDAVLVEAARRLRRSLRASDVTARYGGEEFVVLLPATAEQAALEVAEHVRTALNFDPVVVGDGGPSVELTASLGVATVEPSGSTRSIDAEELIAAADRAVYRAKATGRNRTVGSGRLTQLELDTSRDLPEELIWLADRVDTMMGVPGRSAAVARWAMATAARLGVDHTTVRRTAAAARVADVGKIFASRELLTSSRALTEQERREIRRHPQEGARLVANVSGSPDLASLVLSHHERYDGSGFPNGLAGEDIPIEARIIAVCDAWSCLRMSCPFARGRSTADALSELLDGRGTQFDPAVVHAFAALVSEGLIDDLQAASSEEASGAAVRDNHASRYIAMVSGLSAMAACCTAHACR